MIVIATLAFFLTVLAWLVAPNGTTTTGQPAPEGIMVPADASA